MCFVLVASPPRGGVVRSGCDWEPRENDCSNGLGSRSNRVLDGSLGSVGEVAAVSGVVYSIE